MNSQVIMSNSIVVEIPFNKFIVERMSERQNSIFGLPAAAAAIDDNDAVYIRNTIQLPSKLNVKQVEDAVQRSLATRSADSMDFDDWQGLAAQLLKLRSRHEIQLNLIQNCFFSHILDDAIDNNGGNVIM